VDVVEHEHERPRLREQLEQRAHSAMAAIALVLERHRTSDSEPRQRGQDVSELRLHVVVERGEQARVEPLDVLVQRMHEDGERQLALELRRRPGEHEVSAQLRASRKLRKHARLPDPRLAHQLNRGGRAVERAHERIELLDAPDEGILLASWLRCDALRQRASFCR
jgi:hypothetical protein